MGPVSLRRPVPPLHRPLFYVSIEEFTGHRPARGFPSCRVAFAAVFSGGRFYFSPPLQRPFSSWVRDFVAGRLTVNGLSFFPLCLLFSRDLSRTRTRTPVLTFDHTYSLFLFGTLIASMRMKSPKKVLRALPKRDKVGLFLPRSTLPSPGDSSDFPLPGTDAHGPFPQMTAPASSVDRRFEIDPLDRRDTASLPSPLSKNPYNKARRVCWLSLKWWTPLLQMLFPLDQLPFAASPPPCNSPRSVSRWFF